MQTADASPGGGAGEGAGAAAGAGAGALSCASDVVSNTISGSHRSGVAVTFSRSSKSFWRRSCGTLNNEIGRGAGDGEAVAMDDAVEADAAAAGAVDSSRLHSGEPKSTRDMTLSKRAKRAPKLAHGLQWQAGVGGGRDNTATRSTASISNTCGRRAFR